MLTKTTHTTINNNRPLGNTALFLKYSSASKHTKITYKDSILSGSNQDTITVDVEELKVLHEMIGEILKEID